MSAHGRLGGPFSPEKERQDGNDDDHWVDRNSPDPEARFGLKTSNKGFYGYISHVVQDAGLRADRAGPATRGNIPDGIALPTLAQPQPQVLTPPAC